MLTTSGFSDPAYTFFLTNFIVIYTTLYLFKSVEIEMNEPIETKVKYTFSGHDSFQCRQLWLKKGYDYILSKKSFNDQDAVVKLGVGKNMVSSIRYWLKAFNIIDVKDKPTLFGSKLLADDGWDPFLEDDASLWLLHYYLVKSNIASTYNLIFNEFRREKIVFNKDTFLNFLKRKKEIDSALIFNENTVLEDFNVFVKMYQNSDSGYKDIEDSFSGILSDLKILRTVGKGKEEQYQVENLERDTLSEYILLYVIVENDDYGNSISLSNLEQDHNSPGAIFALNRLGLTNKIVEITRSDKTITFADHAGIKELQFKNKPNAFSILDIYYGK